MAAADPQDWPGLCGGPWPWPSAPVAATRTAAAAAAAGEALRAELAALRPSELCRHGCAVGLAARTQGWVVVFVAGYFSSADVPMSCARASNSGCTV
jgi:hypothetical protein